MENTFTIQDLVDYILEYTNMGSLEELKTYFADESYSHHTAQAVIEFIEDKLTISNMEKKTLEQIRGEFDKERIKEWDKTAMETYKQATQDTPEQKEEWEEELGKLMSTWGKVLYVNKGRIGKGMQTDMYTRFYKFVKQLLDDREREAYHDGYTDGVTRCMDSLNKLEEDKNEGA
jgi:hypothetical protein